MTICNINLARDRQSALVVTDTLHSIDGKPATHGAKFVIVPHLSAALFCRGTHEFLWLVSHHVTVTSYLDFDQLCGMLPGMCRTARDYHAAHIAALDGGLAPALAAVGWSERAGGYAAVHFRHHEGYARHDQPPGCCIAPASANISHIPPRDTEPEIADLIALAELQLARTREEFDECLGTGGDLIAVELRDGAVSVKPVHRLSEHAGDTAASVRGGTWWASLTGLSDG